MSFKTVTGSTKGQLVKGIPPVGGGGGGGTVNSVISSDNTLTITDGAGPNVDTSVAPIDITISTAQTMIGTNSVIVNRWYLISQSTQVTNESDRILIQGVAVNQFAEYAVLIDSITGINNVIKFDTAHDIIVYREDIYENKVYDETGVINSNFPWNNSNVSNNTVINSTFNGIDGTNNILKGNVITSCSIVLQETDINLNSNTFISTDLDIKQNGLNMSNNYMKTGTTVFDSTSFMDSFSYNRIIANSFTNIGGESRAMTFCNIETSESISTMKILNPSLYNLSNKFRNNNIFGTLDMTDPDQFSANTLVPGFTSCPFAGNFILSAGSGATISNVSIANGDSVRFYAGNGSTYTFTYVAIAAVTTSGQLVASNLTSDVIVGRTHGLDFIEFESGFMGDAAVLKTNVVKLV